MISVIIPTLNEARALPAALNALRAASARHGAHEVEVLVCDGGSSDGTQAVSIAAGMQWLSAPRGRGSQMNAGARRARGEWLLFLHADTWLPERALHLIDALPATAEAGCFHHAFSGAHPWLKRVSQLHNWRCRRTHIMYGDQAIFVRRRTFETVGGYPEEALEDVKLSEKLRERAMPVMLDATVITCSRKFEAHGIIRSMARIVLLLLCHRYRLPLAGRRFFEPVR